MIIDCGQCAVRGQACADCVVTFLTIGVGAPTGPEWPPGSADPPGVRAVAGLDPSAPDLDAAERQAIDVLARSGLVPPLRLAPDEPRRRAI